SISIAPRASDTAGSFTITLAGRSAPPERWRRYSSEEKPLSWAICSARTSATSVPSASDSHRGVTPSMPEGTGAVAAFVIEDPVTYLTYNKQHNCRVSNMQGCLHPPVG